MSFIDNKNKKKVQLRGEYKKISPELKFQIVQELEYNNIKELSKKYGIARQTIASYNKAREHIYNKFKKEVLALLYKFVDICLERNLNLSEQDIRKDIKKFLKYREYFKYSESNSLRDLIPESKKDSQKKRIIQFILQQCLSYFNQQKEQLSRSNVVQNIPQQKQIVQIQEESNQQNFQVYQLKLHHWDVDDSSYFYFDKDDEYEIEFY